MPSSVAARRRRLALPALACALAAGALSAPAAAAPASDALPSPAAAAPASGETAGRTSASAQRLLVRSYEWRLGLSRLTVARGPLLVQLRNFGEDPHDVVARKLDRSGRPRGAGQRVGETASGAIAKGTWSMRRGRYALICSLPGHAALGMKASLRVR